MTTTKEQAEKQARGLLIAADDSYEYEQKVEQLTTLILRASQVEELEAALKSTQVGKQSIIDHWLERATKAEAQRDSYKEKAEELDKIRAAVLAKVGYATVTLNEVVQAMEKAEALAEALDCFQAMLDDIDLEKQFLKVDAQ